MHGRAMGRASLPQQRRPRWGGGRCTTIVLLETDPGLVVVLLPVDIDRGLVPVHLVQLPGYQLSANTNTNLSTVVQAGR